MVLLNNRELALLIWMSVALAVGMANSGIRSIIFGVVRAFVVPKILTLVVLMLAYVAMLVTLASRVDLWHLGLLKTSVLWFVGPALFLFFNMQEPWTDRDFFRKTALSTVKLVILIEYFVNTVVFALPIELILQPAITFLVVLSAAAGTNPQAGPVKRAADLLISATGVALLVFGVSRFASDWNILFDTDMRGVALPIWMTVSLLPFIYFISLYAAFELAFVRINRFGSDWRSRSRAKVVLVVSFHFRLRELAAFTGRWQTMLARSTSFREARQVIVEFREAREI